MPSLPCRGARHTSNAAASPRSMRVEMSDFGRLSISPRAAKRSLRRWRAARSPRDASTGRRGSTRSCRNSIWRALVYRAGHDPGSVLESNRLVEIGNHGFRRPTADDRFRSVRSRRHVKQQREFRTEYQYFNLGHSAAAAALGRVDGSDFLTSLARQIFRPLGMDGASGGIAASAHGTHLASGHMVVDEAGCRYRTRHPRTIYRGRPVVADPRRISFPGSAAS